MPLDAISLRAVVEELRPQLLNLRIDKVQQPARDQVILLLRGNKRLLLNLIDPQAQQLRSQLLRHRLHTDSIQWHGLTPQSSRGKAH